MDDIELPQTLQDNKRMFFNQLVATKSGRPNACISLCSEVMPTFT